MSLVDPSFELVDPCPDIYALFKQFDCRFFDNVLACCEVRWSPRMTTCAGICVYEGRGGLCSIRLSKPLLTLRPRRDLVETLLHEMIHAYLFVTRRFSIRDGNDGHGPMFQSHMHRINSSAGTSITVYHSFHAEVANYKQHWWRCAGKCRNARPFYGWVKRASNRAPGPNDLWWERHKQSCGGTFEKVKEPEGYKDKRKKAVAAQKEERTVGVNVNTLSNYFPNTGSGNGQSKGKGGHAGAVSVTGTGTSLTSGGSRTIVVKKPATSTGNSTSTSSTSPIMTAPVSTFAGSGARLGGGTGRSRLLDELQTQTSTARTTSSMTNPANKPSTSGSPTSVSNKGQKGVEPNAMKRSSPKKITAEDAVGTKSLLKWVKKDEEAEGVRPPKRPTRYLDSSSDDDDVVCLDEPVRSRPPVTEREYEPTSAEFFPDRTLDEIGFDDVAMLNSEDDDPSVMCPVCARCMPRSAVNAHLDGCLM